MPRLLGVDIPHNKKIEYALRYVYGIGPTRSKIVLEQAGVDPDIRAHQLDDEQLSKITQTVADLKYLVEGDLRRERTANLKRLMSIRSYRGLRHQRGLPVRGQRTSTNARTRKGGRRTVGVIRKK
ncbi:MAG: 30S ribosomal protein S13 [Verrucomicrobiota bacterium]